MSRTYLVVAVGLVTCTCAFSQPRPNHDIPRFLGRAVTITEPESDPDGYFPKGPASVCLEGPPQRQCYTAPKEFGRIPKVSIVQLQKDMPALFFSVASGGVSGWAMHFALLRPREGTDLEDLFLSDTSISNQGESAFWSDPGISGAQFFVTADYVWGPGESHYSPHRYIISAYVQKRSSDFEGSHYYLEDRYMTTRSYDQDAGDHVLASEKPELAVRLRRLKLEAESRRSVH
jgi:hypothetical protein